MRRRAPALALTLALALLGGAAGNARAMTSEEARTQSFELLNEGVRLYRQGDYRAAEEKLARSSELHLNSFQAYYFLGLARVGARRYALAEEPLKVALDFRPRNLPGRVALGEAYLGMGDLDSARAEFFRALEVRDDYSPAFDGLARIAEAQGDFEKARQLFRGAIRADRGSPDPHVHLGEMELRQERLDEALRELEAAVDLQPDYAPALETLARILIRLERYNEALVAAKEAIEHQAGHPAHREVLGRVFLPMGDFARAEEAFREALERDDDYYEAWDGLALALRSQGRFEEAADILDEVAERPGLDDESALRVRQTAARYRKEGEELERLRAVFESAGAGAGADTTTALATAPVDPYDLMELARLSATVERWDTAAAAASRAAELAPEREDVARLRAYYLLRAGQALEARDAYEELAGRGQARGEDLVNLGVAHARVGNDTAAIEAYRAALDVLDTPPEAYLYLGLALERQGDREGARREFERYLQRSGTLGAQAARIQQFLASTKRSLLPDEDPFAEDDLAEDDPFGKADGAAEPEEPGKKKRKKKDGRKSRKDEDAEAAP